MNYKFQRNYVSGEDPLRQSAAISSIFARFASLKKSLTKEKKQGDIETFVGHIEAFDKLIKYLMHSVFLGNL